MELASHTYLYSHFSTTVVLPVVLLFIKKVFLYLKNTKIPTFNTLPEVLFYIYILVDFRNLSFKQFF